MACSCNIAAHNNIFNKAILSDNANYFSTKEEVKKIINQYPDPNNIKKKQEKNIENIRTEYNWNKIIEQYEILFFNAMSKDEKLFKLASH